MNISEVANLVTAIINILLFGATSAGAYLLFRQWRSDHERSERSYAVDLMMKWVDSLQNNSFGVRRFVEALNKGQCQQLEKAEAFEVNEKELQLAVYILKREFPDVQSLKIAEGQERVALSPVYSLFIRSVATKYLNLLECIMAAWDQGFASRRMIEEEFATVIMGENEAETAMKFFRTAGTGNYPCLNKFIAHLETKASASLEPSADVKPGGTNLLTRWYKARPATAA